MGILVFPGPRHQTAEALRREPRAGPPRTVAGLRTAQVHLADRVGEAEFQLVLFAEPWVPSRGCTLHPDGFPDSGGGCDFPSLRPLSAVGFPAGGEGSLQSVGWAQGLSLHPSECTSPWLQSPFRQKCGFSSLLSSAVVSVAALGKKLQESEAGRPSARPEAGHPRSLTS